MAKEKNYAAEIRRNMKSLGVYRKEYDPAIATLADMRKQYDILTAVFVASGYQFSELTETGSKKAPIVTTLESLRKDILSYMNALGLTPRGAVQTDTAPPKKPEKKNSLAAAFEKLGADSS